MVLLKKILYLYMHNGTAIVCKNSPFYYEMKRKQLSSTSLLQCFAFVVGCRFILLKLFTYILYGSVCI